MKYISLLTFIFLGMTVYLPAQDLVPSINVSGEAEIRVIPDRAVLSFGVETWSKDLAAARKDNDEKMARILLIPQGFGVDKKDVQTDWMSIEPVYDHDQEGRIQSIGSYRVRKNISLTLKDPSRLDALVNAVLNAGANRFDGMVIQSSELRKYRDQARQVAVLAAKEKASSMASDLGQDLGDPLSVTENSVNPYPSARMMTQNVMESYGGSSSSGETTALGQVVIRAQVSVSFKLIPRNTPGR